MGACQGWSLLPSPVKVPASVAPSHEVTLDPEPALILTRLPATNSRFPRPCSVLSPGPLNLHPQVGVHSFKDIAVGAIIGTLSTTLVLSWDPALWLQGLSHANRICVTVRNPVLGYRAVQFSISEQLLSRNVERFGGGLVSKAH